MPLVRKPVPAAAAPAPDWRTQAALMETGSPEQRWSAARALVAEPQAIPALEAALAGADARLKEAIFTSLARQNSAAAFEAALRQLRSDDAPLRTLALDAMRLMPDAAAVRLPDLLADADADIRVLACELARHVPPGIAAPLLANRLACEAEPNVCAAAVEMLAELGSAAELPAVEACAARFDTDPFLGFAVRAAAAQIRARTGA